MPVLMQRRFEEMNLFRLGLIALVTLAVMLGAALNSGSIYRQVTSRSYTAVFSEAGGLKKGDEVRVAGVVVGKVDSVTLHGRTVEAEFTAFRDGRLGETTGAAIKSGTALGTKYLALRPSGGGELANGARIPLERTAAPYDVQELLDTLTRKTEALDVKQTAASMNTLADTFSDTPPELRGAIDGLGRLSDTIASRDAEVQALLKNANGVTGILAERSSNITTLIGDGDLLLTELNRRRDTIRSLLRTVTGTVNELNGVVRDNEQQIGPALEELEGVLDLLNRNDKNLAATVHGLDTYLTSLGEAISSGPWFYAFVANLAATNLAQQNLPSLLDQLTPTSPAAPGGPALPGGQPR